MSDKKEGKQDKGIVILTTNKKTDAKYKGLTISQIREAMISDEWGAQYANDPDSFDKTVLDDKGNNILNLEDYGVRCALYHTEIAKAMDALNLLPVVGAMYCSGEVIELLEDHDDVGSKGIYKVISTPPIVHPSNRNLHYVLVEQRDYVTYTDPVYVTRDFVESDLFTLAKV